MLSLQEKVSKLLGKPADVRLAEGLHRRGLQESNAGIASAAVALLSHGDDPQSQAKLDTLLGQLSKPDGYTVSVAKHAAGKGMLCVKPLVNSNQDGPKGRAKRLCTASKSPYSSQDGGYIMPPAKVAMLADFWDAGYDGDLLGSQLVRNTPDGRQQFSKDGKNWRLVRYA